ncbi:MAG: hypothetical protein L6U99_12880 [Clostridium sp.]|nr:MAG: hypothetical protein L6U99_12880 [Clostridium sp.]
MLSLSCNYKVVIESDKVVYYNFFGFKKTIFYDSIIAKESYYTFKRPKIVLVTNEKKIYNKMVLHFRDGRIVLFT